MSTGRAWIELDRGALEHNAAALRTLLPNGCALMPAVKANAYGHGAVPIARELQRLGIRDYCVASVQEGAELRRGGVLGSILVLGYTHPQDAHMLRYYDLTQTVSGLEHARALDSCGGRIKVHIKLDTGMHRLGIPWENTAAAEAVFSCQSLCVTGLYTHLCCPQEQTVSRQQGQRFYGAVDALKKRGCTASALHILSSYGLLNCPELGGSFARVGIALYGLLSRKGDGEKYGADLRPVLSLKARVACVHTLKPGEGAGYDLAYTARRSSRIATLTVGYADGLPRALAGVGAALLHGHKAPIVGVCMDQTLVDVTDIPAVSVGDIAVLIGRSANAEISACDLAEQTGTISNEILSRLGARLERTVL